MVTCTGHIGIHEGANGRTYGRKMTSWLFYQIFSQRWVTSIFLAMVLRARAPSARAELRYKLTKKQMKTKKHNERRKVSNNSLTNNDGNFIKNLSEEVLTDTQISLLTKGLKFIPTATVKKNKIKRQLLQNYKAFARRMRLKYIFHRQNKSIHPFYVKSNWEPPVQPSVTLEHYLEEVKYTA